ncbi:hypothetical protein BJ138DRAFT_1102304 [Hygrophoropsis aurantiaca]|uniref:Uncharacterized protein n=1 Tax=Hygrophoropsis aurantiaca TaxID=72124 RepID=A0ACB8A9E6_9AGAM|nr:hypothetical protein BJ138DRAFT_1102304 [Hygrophoropsis aurantiaca]
MDNTPSVPVPKTDVSVFIGPIELGILVAVFLFGCSVIQGHTYYSTFKSDPWILKALVTVALLLEAAKVISGASSLWFLTVTSYGNPQAAFAKFPPAADLVILFSCLSGAVIHAVDNVNDP